MGLLIRSMLRHVKQHLWQTVLTFSITAFIVALLSFAFHFISSFQMQLRQYALEKVGSYHYLYYAPKDSGYYGMLCGMAEAFQEDTWFSGVSLTEQEDRAELRLTAASPGIFTSKTMEGKFNAYMEEYFRPRNLESKKVYNRIDKNQNLQSVVSHEYYGQNHNLELLVSYGDLNKSSGIYSLLLAVFFMLASITATAVFTLGAVFQVSAAQRQRDFALFMSIGASGRQIAGMVLLESAFYAVFAIPVGYMLGILFFEVSKSRIDDWLFSISESQPIRLVISVPFFAAMIVCAVLIILYSAYRPARKAVKVRPIEAIRQNQEMFLPKKEYKKPRKIDKKSHQVEKMRTLLQKLSGAEGWLAKKSKERFKRRYRPVLMALSIAFVLCFVLDGFVKYAMEVADRLYGGSSYNISISLYSDDRESLETLAEKMATTTGNGLCRIREAIFNLHEPYQPSQESIDYGVLSIGMVPDIMLISVEENIYQNICRKLGLLGLEEDINGIEGIFIDTERVWSWDGVSYKEHPYEIKTGDRVKIYCETEERLTKYGAEKIFAEYEMEGNEIDITVAGVLDEWPLFTEFHFPVRIAMLVSEGTFLQLEPMRPYAELDKGLYRITLRGMVEDAYETESIARKLIMEQKPSMEQGLSIREEHSMEQIAVSGNIENYDRELQQRKASTAGFQYLLTVLIAILMLVCICGNFVVSWTVANARQREYAILASVGMEPEKIRRMRWIGHLLNATQAFVPGLIVGIVCYQFIYKIYSIEYKLDWHFPWTGLALGVAVLSISLILTELAMSVLYNGKTAAETLHVSE